MSWSKTSLSFYGLGFVVVTLPVRSTKIRYKGGRCGYPIGPCESLAVTDKSQDMNGCDLRVLFAFRRINIYMEKSAEKKEKTEKKKKPCIPCRRFSYVKCTDYSV